jgi:hypothetical protein
MERNDVYKDPRRLNRFYFVFHNQLGRFNFPFSDGTNCVNDASQFTPFVPYIVEGFPEKPEQPVAVDTRENSQLILVASDVLDREGCGGLVGCPPATGNIFNLMLTRDGDTEPTGVYEADDPRQPVWEITAQSIDDPFVSVAVVPRSTGTNAYAITRSGALYTASIPLPVPAAIDWTRQSGFVPAGEEGVRHFVTLGENTVFAITKNWFAKTSDAGGTWTIFKNTIPASSYYSVALDFNFLATVEIYVGTSNGVYRSTDGGTTWLKRNGNLPNVKVVQMFRESIFLYAVTFGRGLWRMSTIENIGISELSPTHSAVAVGERVDIALKWTHPERWRLLDKVDLRLVDDEGSSMWLRFDETSGTFSIYNPNSGRFGEPARPGSPNRFESNSATMYLEDSVVQGSGPTGPNVTLTYNLSFKPQAAGRTFRVEAFATDDSGRQQGFETVGTLTVLP